MTPGGVYIVNFTVTQHKGRSKKMINCRNCRKQGVFEFSVTSER